MTSASKPRRRRRLPVFFTASALLLAMAWLTAGCGGVYLNPGPQAAILAVPVRGQVTPDQRAQAALPYGGLEWAGFSPYQSEFSEPLWDAQAFIIAPDGGYHQLPPAPGSAIQEREGYAMDAVARFLSPPGTHKIRVIFTCSVRRDYWDEFGRQRQYLYLLAKERVLDLTLPPGGSVTVEGFTGP